MDIDEFRQPQIRLHGLTGADGIYTFYHDHVASSHDVKKLDLFLRFADEI